MMLRLSCNVDALCGCEFLTSGCVESCSRSYDAPSPQSGSIVIIEEQRNSGGRVPKFEATGQYKLVLVPRAAAVWRERATGDGSKLSRNSNVCDGD
jgi:hypothetical protein